MVLTVKETNGAETDSTAHLIKPYDFLHYAVAGVLRGALVVLETMNNLLAQAFSATASRFC
jgi:hypothetical protein